MTNYTLVTHNSKDDSNRRCLVNSNSLEYIVRIAQLMLYSREDHDKIEARQDDKSLFVLARKAGFGDHLTIASRAVAMA